ncbi:hypothetical protein ABDC18_002877 [Escherichia coli]
MSWDFRYWTYMYKDKKPIGRERKFCLVGERLVDAEEQGKRNRSCYFAKDQIKIGQLQKVWHKDRLGRNISYGVDRCIVLTYNPDHLLVWNPLYAKGQTICLQCINPGFEGYRCLKKASDLLVITDQVIANIQRDQTDYDLVDKGGKSRSPVWEPIKREDG